MKFIPNRKISYKQVFRPAGKVFEIDPADADEMAKYGTVERPAEPEQPLEQTETPAARKQRPRKGESE